MRKPRGRISLLLSSLFMMLSVIAACGGGGGGGTTNPGMNAMPSVVTKVYSSVSATICPTGGIQVDAGIDSNGNGVLDPSEVDSTQYVCNGANGTNGLDALVSVVTEPSGTNCTYGGKKVNVGIDTNRNGVLDNAEITSFGYVCNGASGSNGSNGTNGNNGLNSLVSIVSEPAGSNCAAGGIKVSSGLDANGNGSLDQPGEVASTNYVCSPSLPPSTGFAWVDVTTTSIQAAANTGYLADNASLVIVKLPPSSSLTMGDIVRVSGVGAGGWRLAQNAGQAIITKDMQAYGPRAGGTPTPIGANWSAIAMSSDGTKLAAAISGGDIYLSSNSGVSWSPMGAGSLNWKSLAMSSDGTKGVAAVLGGYIATTWNSGLSGTITSAPTASWVSVAGSSDLTKIVAAISGGGIYTSPDFGSNWSLTTAPVYSWSSVASSSDGTKLVAAGNPGAILTSSNSGGNWTTTTAPISNWTSVASSSDGTKLVAAIYPGGIYTSSDSGGSWNLTSAPTNSWTSVASSSDGTILYAGSDLGGMYYSPDSGATWIRKGTFIARMSGVASSSNGAKFAFCISGVGGASTTTPTYISSTLTGTSGMIIGGQYDAIELQYIGTDTFMVLSHEGILSVF